MSNKKLCTYCKKQKDTTEFHKSQREPDGLQCWCKSCRKMTNAEHYKRNAEKILARNAEWYKNNTQKRLRSCRAWEKRNPDKMRALWCRQHKKWKKTIRCRLNQSIKGSIWKSLKSNKAGRPWESLVGYTVVQLKKHLERLFVEGMAWDNYGKWHIDHKIPKSVFNFSKPEDLDFKRCWALENLQPLWARDNINKRDKLTNHFQPSLAF